MAESFLDYLGRLTDEIHAIQKTAEEKFEAKIDRLTAQLAQSRAEADKRFAESRVEHQRRMDEADKRREESRVEHQRRMDEADKRWAEHQRWMEQADKRFAESRVEHQRWMDEADKRREESRAEHQRWMDEADKRWAEHQRWMEQADKRFAESRVEHQRWMDEADKRREESRAEHQRRMDEADKRWAEHQRWMEQADKRWGDIANVQGEIAEDLFRRNAAATLHAHGIQVDEVHHHLKGPGTREYDVVAVNGGEAVVFEIKNKLRSDDATRFLRTQLPQFKTAFPQYGTYRVYGGMGALVMSREQEAEVAAMGLFVLTQGEDGAARLQKPKNLRAW